MQKLASALQEAQTQLADCELRLVKANNKVLALTQKVDELNTKLAWCEEEYEKAERDYDKAEQALQQLQGLCFEIHEHFFHSYTTIRGYLPTTVVDPRPGHHDYLPAQTLAGLYTSDFDIARLNGNGLQWFDHTILLRNVTYADLLDNGRIGFLYEVGEHLTNQPLNFSRWFSHTYDPDPPRPGNHDSGIVGSWLKMRLTSDWEYCPAAYRSYLYAMWLRIYTRVDQIFQLFDRCSQFMQDVEPLLHSMRSSGSSDVAHSVS